MYSEKEHSFRASCEKAGVAIWLRARNLQDAENKLISSVGYWQANKKFKTIKKDWVIEEPKEE